MGPCANQLAHEIHNAINQFGLSFADWNRLLSILCLLPCDCGRKGQDNGH